MLGDRQLWRHAGWRGGAPLLAGCREENGLEPWKIVTGLSTFLGNYSPDELAEYSGRMVRDIRSEFRTRIQAQIMDARLTVNKRCYRLPQNSN